MSEKQYSVSVIICSYQRHKWVEKLLVSIAEQTVQPTEIIIVDASADTKYYTSPRNLKVNYIQSGKMQLTYQKNLGLDVATGDIIFFLDDDLLLEYNFVEETLKVFRDDEVRNIGAVSGYITNQWGTGSSDPGIFLKLIKLLNIYDGDFSPGSVSPSGIFIELNTLQPFSGIKMVDFVPGGCVAFRKEVFEQYLPPLVIDKYGGEDKTFSRMIATDWQMCVCGDARVQHFSAGGGARPSHFSHTKSAAGVNLYIQRYYGISNPSILRLRLYYILNAFRMYVISIAMFISVVKTRKSVKWFLRASGYLGGALSPVDISNE